MPERQPYIPNTPASDKLTGDSKWTKLDPVAGLKQWQDAGWRSSLPQHSVILNNILSVGCVPVALDGSQPGQRHAFFSPLANVISAELILSA